MCPTDNQFDNPTAAPLAAETLCLDFKLKAQYFVEPLTKFLEQNRVALGLEDAEDLIAAYLERILPNGLPGSVMISNASFDQFERWIMRPVVDGPLADTFAVRGVVPAFTGYRRHGAIVIDGFTTTDHIAPRAFERRVSGTIHINPENPSMTQADFAVLAQLPAPRLLTKEQLELFLGFLEWRKDLVFIGQVAVPYSGYVRAEDGSITFTVHGNGEIARVAQSRGMVMFATGLHYSLSRRRWTPIPRVRPQMVRVGEVAKAWRADTADDAPSEPTGSAEGHSGHSTAFVTIRPQAESDAAEEELDIPEEGFLLSAVGGDMKPINSERRAINRFLSGKGHNWYLADYLFDIRNAAVPADVPDAVAEFGPLTPLNERQRRAVNKGLAVHDIALIQGPPGTGKTTVIAELCYQLARRGRRVLVVSQANGAVDNALSRLSADPALRPLRIGKTDRVEEQGQPFTPQNALHHWLLAAGRTCRQQMRSAETLAQRIATAQEAFTRGESLLTHFQEASGQTQQLTDRANELRERRDNLYAQYAQLDDRGDHNRRMQAALTELARAPQQSIRNFTSIDFLADTRLPTIAATTGKSLTKTLSRSRWQVPWLTQESPHSAFAILASAQQAIIAAETLSSSIAEAISLCSNDTQQSPEGQEIAALYAQRAALLNSSDDADLLKVAEINRRIKQLQASSWGRLCRTISDALGPIFVGDLPAELDQFVSSLGPDPKFTTILEGLSHLAMCLTQQCRTILEAGLVEIAEQAKAELATVQAETERIRQQREEIEPLIDVDARDIEEIEHQLDTLQSQVDECRSRWAELWPSLCADLDTPESVPELSRASLDRRSEQFNRWQEANGAAHERGRKWQAIQQDWLGYVEKAETAEDKGFRSLYAEHDNVVGLTCLESGQPSFYEDDDFEPYDVVIIDEVSKATPTELLMAMMLARTVILVGDQRQLPPMFKEKESSFTEALEEGRIQAQDFEKYRNLVTASLFAKLFEHAPEPLRESLFDHYRSHEQIVSIFNLFYDGRLVIAGGAESLNQRRQHYLRIKDRNGGWFLEPNQHVLWIDSSRRANGQWFTERQAGSSKVNLLEVDLIIASLMRLNWGLRDRGYGPIKTAQAKSREKGLTLQTWVRQLLPKAAAETIADLFAHQQVRIDGRVAPADHLVIASSKGKATVASSAAISRWLPQGWQRLLMSRSDFAFAGLSKAKETIMIDARMPIGVITFYGAQLGQIRKKIAEVNATNPCYLDACNIQSNTVDKFQGKEMPIVLVSLVRAPEHRHVGTFCKEYRRINVAFSRAQNLLIIVGNERTFRDVPVEVPSMEDGTIRKVYVYRRIFELITQYGGRRYARDLLKW
jgi:hypothetical protein